MRRRRRRRLPLPLQEIPVLVRTHAGSGGLQISGRVVPLVLEDEPEQAVGVVVGADALAVAVLQAAAVSGGEAAAKATAEDSGGARTPVQGGIVALELREALGHSRWLISALQFIQDVLL